MKILFVGGGTGGSVTPLLALAQYLKVHSFDQPIEFIWLGTYRGPEKNMVLAEDINFISVFSGKWRRYFSWQNFTDVLFILLGFLQSLYYLHRLKPDILISAGSFVAVPVGLAAFLFRCPQIIHQQDIAKGLANKLLSFFAKKITVSFPEQLPNFPANKTVLTGNPVRLHILQGNREKAIQLLGLEPNLATILVVGGGTGALRLNQIISGALPELVQFCQVIHISGKNKKISALALKDFSPRYHQFDFIINEMPDFLAIADLVITRGGMGFLSELSALGKPTIIIPIPQSHQEFNANYFCQQQSAICLPQDSLSSQSLIDDIKHLLTDEESLCFLSRNIKKNFNPDAARLLAVTIFKVYAEKNS